jgi:hypothetical protein
MAVGCVMPDSTHRISAQEMGRAMGTLSISNWHFIAMFAISAVFSEVHANAQELVEHWHWLPQLPGVYCVRYVYRQKKHFKNRAYNSVFRWETTCSTVHVLYEALTEAEEIGEHCAYNADCVEMSVKHILQYCRVCSVWGTSLAWGNSSVSGIHNDSC